MVVYRQIVHYTRNLFTVSMLALRLADHKSTIIIFYSMNEYDKTNHGEEMIVTKQKLQRINV